MKARIILSFILLFYFSAGAQTPAKKKSEDKSSKATLTLLPKEDVITTVDLGPEGFILKTGVEYAGREGKIRLHKYKTDLTKVWTVEIAKSTNSMLENYILASPFSSYTYYIQETKVSNKSAGKIVITRIDEKGKSTMYDIKVTKDDGKSEKKGKNSSWPKSDKNTQYIAAFVDETSFYLLASLETVNTKKDVKKKNVSKKEARVVLFKAAHKSREISSFETDIQMNADDATADLFVEYLGQDDDNIYVSKKSVSLKDKTLTYNILTLDKDGARTDETTIESNIEGLPVPAVNFRESYGSRIYNNDYDVITTTHTSGNRTYYTYTYIANAGSFGCAQLDFINGKFYIYGLSKSPKKKEANKGKTKGKDKSKTNESDLEQEADYLYVHQYDFSTGELINAYEKPLPKDLLADKAFTNPSVFYYRNIWLDVLGPNLIRFNGVIDGSPKLHTVCIDLSSDKMEYAGKEVPLRKNGGSGHRRYLTNIIATKMESTKSYQQFLKANTEFRTKEFSMFALLVGDKRIVAKNYSFTKTPKIEFTAFPINGAETEPEN